MQEQMLEISDERHGATCKVERHNSTQNRTRFKNSIASIGDEVTILKSDHYQKLLDDVTKIDKYIAKINKLEQEINDADIRTLKQDNEDLKKKLKNKEKSIDNYKTNSAKSKGTIETLQEKITKYQETIQENQSTISELKSLNDNLGMQLDNSIDESELKDLKSEVAGLKKQLAESESKYNSIFSDYTKISDENIAYIEEINQLKETNKFLNEQVGALTSSIIDNNSELESKHQSEQKELKETIEKQQTHIDELSDKYQSLLPLENNIEQSQHYNEISALKDKLNEVTIELNKSKANIETKLAVQEKELASDHADKIAEIKETHAGEINNIKEKHTDEKAQMLVAYNKELDYLKMEYNNLANDYNNLLEQVQSLTRMNTLFDAKHKKISEDKIKVELMEIKSEQLPSDDETIEYVPKDTLTII